MADILIKTENNNKVVEIKNENASEINYTNTQSSLQANNVQNAIDEVNSYLWNKVNTSNDWGLSVTNISFEPNNNRIHFRFSNGEGGYISVTKY